MNIDVDPDAHCPCCGRRKQATSCPWCRDMPTHVKRGYTQWPWLQGHGPDTRCPRDLDREERRERFKRLQAKQKSQGNH